MAAYDTTIDPKIITIDEKPIFQFEQDSLLAVDRAGKILNNDWARSAFMIREQTNQAGDVVGPGLDPTDATNRFFSSAFFKFQDTSVGGDNPINPKPQFTPYADARTPGWHINNRARVDHVKENFIGKTGMGRYYSEAIHDNSQLVYMSFGVPAFNSLTTFFSGFYNNSVATNVRTGRDTGFFEFLGKTIGTVLLYAAAIVLWPVTLSIAAGRAIKYLAGKDTSKFYTFKPTMFNYFAAATTIVNTIATNRGFLPEIATWALDKSSKDQKINDVYKPDMTLLKELSQDQLLGGLIDENGGIDLFAICSKAQIYAQLLDKQWGEQFDKTSSSDFSGYVKKSAFDKLETPLGKPNFFSSLNKFLSTDVNKHTYDLGKSATASEETNKDGTSKEGNKSPSVESYFRVDPKNPSKQVELGVANSFRNYWESVFNDGLSAVCFRVDYTGSVSESFSNAVGENQLASTMNGISGKSRENSFTFAGGNLDDGAISKIVGGVITAAKDVVAGALDAMHVSGLMSLGGSAFVDIPKHWQSSAVNLPKSTYTMTLISPYGNAISQLINLYIPLSLLLAGACPLSTGRQSYTSPFICQLFDQGRSQTRLGMIDSLTIQRGTSNLGFNKAKSPMAIDVSFSVVDLSSIMHLPISRGLFESGEGIFDDDTVFHDYMAVLGSLGLYEQFNVIPKTILKTANKIKNYQLLRSPAAMAKFFHEKTPVGVLDVFYKGSSVFSSSGIASPNR